jgi:hypothetical protein
MSRVIPAPAPTEQPRPPRERSNRRMPKLRLVIPLLLVVLAILTVVTISIVPAGAKSIRESSGYTGQHTHVTWAGPGVGVIAWTVGADFVSWTSCGSKTAGLTVDASWNSASLHNGAELDIMYTVQRSDGRHFEVGNVAKITKAEPWPGHPAFGGQFRASVYTPAGTYLKYATVTSWIVNGGVAYPPAGSNTVKLAQSTRSC